MTKHVFRIGAYGSIYHEGEFVKETDKTITSKHFKRSTRMNKGHDCVVAETDDPGAIVSAWGAAWRAHDAAVKEAAETLAAAKRVQKDAAYHSAFGGLK